MPSDLLVYLRLPSENRVAEYHFQESQSYGMGEYTPESRDALCRWLGRIRDAGGYENYERE